MPVAHSIQPQDYLPLLVTPRERPGQANPVEAARNVTDL